MGKMGDLKCLWSEKKWTLILTVAVPEIWNILEIQKNGGKKCAHSFEVPITFLELF